MSVESFLVCVWSVNVLQFCQYSPHSAISTQSMSWQGNVQPVKWCLNPCSAVGEVHTLSVCTTAAAEIPTRQAEWVGTAQCHQPKVQRTGSWHETCEYTTTMNDHQKKPKTRLLWVIEMICVCLAMSLSMAQTLWWLFVSDCFSKFFFFSETFLFHLCCITSSYSYILYSHGEEWEGNFPIFCLDKTLIFPFSGCCLNEICDALLSDNLSQALLVSVLVILTNCKITQDFFSILN